MYVYMFMQKKQKGEPRRKEGYESYSWTIIFAFFMAINLILARISLSPQLYLCSVVTTTATLLFTYM